jgi:hypothetical protein
MKHVESERQTFAGHPSSLPLGYLLPDVVLVLELQGFELLVLLQSEVVVQSIFVIGIFIRI